MSHSDAQAQLAEIMRRVLAASSTGGTHLDLSGLSLRRLPILELDLFASLDISHNDITHLSDSDFGFPRGQSSLEVLKISSNPIESIGGIWSLQKLRTLIADGTNLSHLEKSFCDFKYLTHLDLRNCRFTSFPAIITECISLTTLLLDGCQLSKIPPEIAKLEKLTALSISNCRLSSLPDIFDHFPSLELLDIKGNPLVALPKTILTLHHLRTLRLDEKAFNIPPEIQGRGAKPILAYYFAVSKSDSKLRLNEAKMVVVGQGGVGKTTLVKRLLGQEIDEHEETTRGIRIVPWRDGAGADQIKINIWDFGGQEIMHATHQFFLTQRTLYILVIDSRTGERESRLEYWLKIIQAFGGQSPIIIVCNKSDQHTLSLNENGLYQKYASLRHIASRVSCVGQAVGVSELRDAVLTEIIRMDHVRDRLPSSWIDVKNTLEKMTGDYILYSAYQNLCKEKGVVSVSDQTLLCRFLHDLGVVLNFSDDPRLSDTNILNPGWVTNGVYQILNARLDGGILAYADLNNILDNERYSQREHHSFIVGMMKKFELCFEFDGAPGVYLLPDLLPKNEPDTGTWQSALDFQYRYDVLPSSIISRFIVRMKPWISRNTYWRDGVVIAKDQCRALVRADLEDAIIYVSVLGDGKRRLLLDAIRSQFELIHSTISNLNVEEKVPLPDNPAVVADYKHLRTLIEMKVHEFVPEGASKTYSVEQLLDGVEAPERRERLTEPAVRLETVSEGVREAVKDHAERLSPWRFGGFLVLAVVVFAGVFAYIAKSAGALSLPLVLTAAIVGVIIVATFMLFVGKLISERSLRELNSTALAALKRERNTATFKARQREAGVKKKK